MLNLLSALAMVCVLAAPDGGTVEVSPREFYQAAADDQAAGEPKTALADEVARWLAEGSALLVDLRSKEDFAREHLSGAVNLPATELTDERVAKVVPSKTTRVVVYCDDQLMPTRKVALTTFGAPALRRLGYTKVLVLEPLYLRRDAGLSLVRSKK